MGMFIMMQMKWQEEQVITCRSYVFTIYLKIKWQSIFTGRGATQLMHVSSTEAGGSLEVYRIRLLYFLK